MPRPATPRARGDAARQAATVLRMLATAPRRPRDIAASLGVSRRTIERVLRGIEAAGWKIEVERRGSEAWYSVTEVR